MAYFLIASSSGDEPLWVKKTASEFEAMQKGRAYGYIPAYKSTDPFLVVKDTSALGVLLNAMYHEDPRINGRFAQGGFNLRPRDHQHNEVLVRTLFEAAEADDALGNVPHDVPGFGEFVHPDEEEEE